MTVPASPPNELALIGDKGELCVRFDDDECHLLPGDDLVFGREADLVIDSNPHLHRHLGRFRWRDGVWWLANLGSAIALDVCDARSLSHLTITPGRSAPVPFVDSRVRFRAGSAVYELAVTSGQVVDLAAVSGTLVAAGGTTTISAARMSLNAEQRLLLVALAERRLRHPALPPSEIPPNKQVADRLGWAITKFNRKLDYLCALFGRCGVAGLKGDVAGLASNRRERLVEHVITAGLITPHDLDLLDSSASN